MRKNKLTWCADLDIIKIYTFWLLAWHKKIFNGWDVVWYQQTEQIKNMKRENHPQFFSKCCYCRNQHLNSRRKDKKLLKGFHLIHSRYKCFSKFVRLVEQEVNNLRKILWNKKVLEKTIYCIYKMIVYCNCHIIYTNQAIISSLPSKQAFNCQVFVVSYDGYLIRMWSDLGSCLKIYQ